MEMQITVKVPEPGQELVNFVTGHLKTHGGSVSRSAAQHGISQQNARAALLGAWNGPRARAVRQLLIAEALGLDPLQSAPPPGE